MTFKLSDYGQFSQFVEHRPFIERLVNGLRNDGELDSHKARVRAAVALGLLPMAELAQVIPAPGEIDAAFRCTLQIRQIFTESVEGINRHAEEPPLSRTAPGASPGTQRVYRYLRRGDNQP